MGAECICEACQKVQKLSGMSLYFSTTVFTNAMPLNLLYATEVVINTSTLKILCFLHWLHFSFKSALNM